MMAEPVRGGFPDPGVLALPGIEQARAELRGLVPRSPLSRLVGYRLTQVSSGSATLSMPASPWLQHADGTLEDTFRRLTENPAALRAIPAIRAAAALAACECGHDDEAQQLFEPLVASGFAAIPLDSLWLWGMTTSVHVSAALRDADAARAAAALLVSYADQWVTVMTMVSGSVAHYLGVAATVFGDYAEAERRFTGADAADARAQARGWQARTRLEWARMFIRRGDPGDTGWATQLAGEALVTAEELGMAGVAARAGEVLGST